MIFHQIFWRFFGKISRHNIWRDSSMQQDHASLDMEDALEYFKKFIEEHKDFVLL
jgi:hypothetical protein